MAMVARMPIIIITTSNSIRVKPLLQFRGNCKLLFESQKNGNLKILSKCYAELAEKPQKSHIMLLLQYVELNYLYV